MLFFSYFKPFSKHCNQSVEITIQTLAFWDFSPWVHIYLPNAKQINILFLQIFRISQTSGQMRLSCRRRSYTPSEDVLQKEEEESEDDDLDENVLQDVQCKRRMAVVMD